MAHRASGALNPGTRAAAARRLRAGAIALAAVAVAVVAQEFAIRLALPAYDPTAHVRFDLDPRLGVPRGRPNSVQRQVLNAGDSDVTVTFNRYGLRDRRDVATGTARDIYVVGDSFAFGWGVEETERFSDQLEPLIGRRVFNIGTPADLAGYERLIDEAIRLGADVRRVVVAVNMIDDIQDYARADAPAADPPFAVRLLPIKSYLVANSSLYFLATSLVHGVPWLKRLMVRAGLIVPLQAVLAAAPTPRRIASSADRLAGLARRFDTLVVVIPSRGVRCRAVGTRAIGCRHEDGAGAWRQSDAFPLPQRRPLASRRPPHRRRGDRRHMARRDAVIGAPRRAV
jgi:hypothetical protein